MHEPRSFANGNGGDSTGNSDIIPLHLRHNLETAMARASHVSFWTVQP